MNKIDYILQVMRRLEGKRLKPNDFNLLCGLAKLTAQHGTASMTMLRVLMGNPNVSAPMDRLLNLGYAKESDKLPPRVKHAPQVSVAYYISQKGIKALDDLLKGGEG